MYVSTSIVFAFICAGVAHSKGRNPVGWFFIGLILSWIGLIMVMVVAEVDEDGVPIAPGRPDVETRDRARRLEEELRLERTRLETLEREVQDTRRRIALHDQALGIETRRLDPAPPRDPRFLPPEDELPGDLSGGWSPVG